MLLFEIAHRFHEVLQPGAVEKLAGAVISCRKKAFLRLASTFTILRNLRRPLQLLFCFPVNGFTTYNATAFFRHFFLRLSTGGQHTAHHRAQSKGDERIHEQRSPPAHAGEQLTDTKSGACAQAAAYDNFFVTIHC
jgi:hypothetical protein